LQLRAANIDPAAQAFYNDHHAYTEKDIRELVELKEKSEAGGFVTRKKTRQPGRISFFPATALGCAGENGTHGRR